MSYEDAKQYFKNSRNLTFRGQPLPLGGFEEERHGLYEGLLNLTFAIEEDLKAIKHHLGLTSDDADLTGHD